MMESSNLETLKGLSERPWIRKLFLYFSEFETMIVGYVNELQHLDD